MLKIHNKHDLTEEMQIESIPQANSNEAENLNSNQSGLQLLSSLCRNTIKSPVKEREDLIAEFESEKFTFINLVKKSETKLTTNEFWLQNRKKLPFLYDISLRLLSIPATSAFIERFFSVTGLINNNRSQNKRSMLKVNMNLLDEFE